MNPAASLLLPTMLYLSGFIVISTTFIMEAAAFKIITWVPYINNSLHIDSVWELLHLS